MMLGHDTLGNFMQTNFIMIQQHNYSMDEIGSMMPWKRRYFIHLLVKHLEKEKKESESRYA